MNTSTTWPSPTIATFSTETRVEWIPEAYSSRRWFRQRVRGVWFADNVRHPGMWGEGDTPEAALDDLVLAIQHRPIR